MGGEPPGGKEREEGEVGQIERIGDVAQGAKRAEHGLRERTGCGGESEHDVGKDGGDAGAPQQVIGGQSPRTTGVGQQGEDDERERAADADGAWLGATRVRVGDGGAGGPDEPIRKEAEGPDGQGDERGGAGKGCRNGYVQSRAWPEAPGEREKQRVGGVKPGLEGE